MLTGTLADINATLSALNNIVYRGNANVSGSDTLTMTPPPISATPARAGAQTDVDTVAITLTPVADAPAVTITTPTSSPAEDNAFSLPVSATLTDTDGSETLTALTLSGLPNGFVVSDGRRQQRHVERRRRHRHSRLEPGQSVGHAPAELQRHAQPLRQCHLDRGRQQRHGHDGAECVRHDHTGERCACEYGAWCAGGERGHQPGDLRTGYRRR